MKHTFIILILTSLFSFSVFGKESKMLNNDTVPLNKKTVRISQTQLDELYKLSSYGINLVKDKYISLGTFLPVIFSYSNNKVFNVIKYDDPGIKDTLQADFAHEILIRITKRELQNDNIRIVCIGYRGKIKNAKYPQGNDCISMLFISKEFDNSVLYSFPVKIEDEKLMFDEVEVRIIKNNTGRKVSWAVQ